MELISSSQIGIRLETHWSVSLQSTLHTILTTRNWLDAYKGAQKQKMQMMNRKSLE